MGGGGIIKYKTGTDNATWETNEKEKNDSLIVFGVMFGVVVFIFA